MNREVGGGAGHMDLYRSMSRPNTADGKKRGRRRDMKRWGLRGGRRLVTRQFSRPGLHVHRKSNQRVLRRTSTDLS